MLGARQAEPRGNGGNCRLPAKARLDGVAFHSYSEPHLSTDNELVRDVLLAVMASLAKVERQKISERTRAGLARVRAKGVRLGRPAIGDKVQAKITALARDNPAMTAYAIAKAVGCDVKTAAKYASAGREVRQAT